jgi:4-amino-4-deoxy-L-arabinose transferase-like glycosyltransferase
MKSFKPTPGQGGQPQAPVPGPGQLRNYTNVTNSAGGQAPVPAPQGPGMATPLPAINTPIPNSGPGGPGGAGFQPPVNQQRVLPPPVQPGPTNTPRPGSPPSHPGVGNAAPGGVVNQQRVLPPPVQPGPANTPRPGAPPSHPGIASPGPGTPGNPPRPPVTNPPSNGLSLRGRGRLHEPEIVNGNIILYRAQHFFVRTAYRPGQVRRPGMFRRPSGPGRPLPEQEGRVINSETRIMPNVALKNAAKAVKRSVPAWLESIMVVIGLLASLVAHAINVFNFPRYEIDEGTYMASAWAILHGELANYPYGYGHPPLAWMQLAALVQLVGGFFTFGNAINTGRVIMLFYTVGGTLLVYLIVRRLTGSRMMGMLALVFFALSPIGVDFQRLVLLDNFATFWLLVSLYLIVVSESRLLYIVLGGVAFGCALLSKEVCIMFVPAMVYAVWLHTTKFQRKFILVAFLYTVVALGSSFVLLAVLKGELFPYKWHVFGDNHQHLSFLDTYVQQVARVGTGGGDIQTSWQNWVQIDSIFMYASSAAIVFNLLVGWWNRKQLLFALLAVSFWILLLRGLISSSGVVFSFYIIPLIPLCAINMVLALQTIANGIIKVIRWEFIRVLLALGVIAAILPYDVMGSMIVVQQHPTSVQTEAMLWARQHIPRNDFVVIPPYLYMDLRVPGGEGVGDGAVFPYAHVYFNVEGDPEIYGKILQNNWDRIDYFIADSGMEDYLRSQVPATDPGHIIVVAFQHSVQVAQFSTPDHGDQLIIKIYKVQHQAPSPTVSAPSPPGVSAPALTKGTMPIDRRLFIG